MLTVEERLGKRVALSADDCCRPDLNIDSCVMASAAEDGLDASGFSLVTWNIQKESGAAWEADFERLAREADLFVVQEAFLTQKFKALLAQKPYYWHLVTAFEIQQVKAGVMTAATVAPDLVCPLRAVEPLIQVPKTALITRYPLADSDRPLMVANIHMINFAPDLSAFHDQAQRMFEILAAHPGPMIVSGDFNTWRARRLAIIDEMIDRLELKQVQFDPDFSRKVFGYAVDRIYYRGLIPQAARVTRVASSDHNPLIVRFRVENED